MRGTQSSESESRRTAALMLGRFLYFRLLMHATEKEHASVDQNNAANLATQNLPVFNSFLRQVVIFMLLGRVLGMVGLAGWHLRTERIRHDDGFFPM